MAQSPQPTKPGELFSPSRLMSTTFLATDSAVVSITISSLALAGSGGRVVDVGSVANEVGSVDDGFGVGTRRISSRAEAIGSARRVSLCGLTIRVRGRGGDAGSGVPFAGVAAVGGGEKGSLRACP